MPTLMETSLSQVPALPSENISMPPTALTLSVGGVEFCLTPSDPEAEVSYKKKGQDIVLSLNSFSGSLLVSLKENVPRSTPTVEEEPTVEVERPKPQKVSPGGQTKLPFPKQKSDNKMKKKAKAKERKRTIEEMETPKTSSTKKTRQNSTESSVPLTRVPTLCQTQATQEAPDLSQTLSSGNEANSNDLSSSSFSAMNVSKPAASVKEILDRVNSSNDSVATVRDDDENSNVSNNHKPGGDKPTIEITEGKTDDAMETSAIVHEVTPPPKPVPCPRWGHTMTKIKGDKLLVYGGQSFDIHGDPVMLDDVHVYNMASGTWEKPINCRGDQRQWHSATYLEERQLIISFGGETVDKVKNKVITSDTLRVLDTDIMLWYPPAVSGDIPTGRSGHSATLLPNTNELILFGGVKGSRWLNTVSVLDTVRWIWTTPKVEGMAPKPRSYHTTTAVKDKLVIFGGNNKTSCFNTVHVLEASTDGWKWSHPSTTGKAPFPRTGHSATLLEDGKTICFYGGWDPNEEDSATGEENIFKGSFLLDTSTWTWSKGPKACAAGNGTDSLDDCGPKRCGHTSVLNPQGGEVMVYGGRIPGERLAGDFQKLSEDIVGLDG